MRLLSSVENSDHPDVRFRLGVQKNMDVLLIRVIRTVLNAMDRQIEKHLHQSQHQKQTAWWVSEERNQSP